jgi:hypothetical protein
VSLPGCLLKIRRKKWKVVLKGKGWKGEKDADIVEGKAEPTVDEACWIYEQLRLVSFLPVFYFFELYF